MLFFSVFLSPFNFWAFFSGEGPIPVKLIVSLFDLICLAGWGAFVYQLFRGLKYGESVLAFDGFPFFLGDRLEARFTGADRFLDYTKLTVTLRCVEEALEKDGDSNAVKCYSRWEDQKSYAPGELSFSLGEPSRVLQVFRRADSGAVLSVSFPLPAEDLGTMLSESPSRYWEVEVKAETPGIDFGATFLVPVYSKVLLSAIPVI
jgi:hypothetical protein